MPINITSQNFMPTNTIIQYVQPINTTSQYYMPTNTVGAYLIPTNTTEQYFMQQTLPVNIFCLQIILENI